MSFVSLGEVADVFNGKTPAKSEQREVGHPVLKIRDVDDVGRFRGRFGSFVDEEFVAQFGKKQVLPGDTLILNAAHNADYVGSKSFLAAEDVRGALATGEWLLVRPNHKRLDPGFAHYWLTSAAARAAIRDQVKGIHLYPKDVARLSIPLPPLDEQRQIAAILDKADALRRKRKRALELLDGLMQSIFLEMFVRNASDDWKVVTVADVAEDMRTGPFGSQLLHSEFTDAGVAVLGIDNAVANEFRWSQRRFISKAKYETLKRYTVHPEDVLITIMGTCGRCAIVPQDIPVAINTKHLCCTTLDQRKCLPEFLHSTFLRSPEVQKQLGVQAKGAVMPGLNMSIIKSLKFGLPPLSVQQLFVERVGASKAAAEAMARQLERVEASFASLQHRAFSGQL